MVHQKLFVMDFVHKMEEVDRLTKTIREKENEIKRKLVIAIKDGELLRVFPASVIIGFVGKDVHIFLDVTISKELATVMKRFSDRVILDYCEYRVTYNSARKITVQVPPEYIITAIADLGLSITNEDIENEMQRVMDGMNGERYSTVGFERVKNLVSTCEIIRKELNREENQ